MEGIEVLPAVGGNPAHYPVELDWLDDQRFFAPGLKWGQLGSTGFRDNAPPQVLDGSVALPDAPGLHTIPLAASAVAAMLDHAQHLKRWRIDQRGHFWNLLKSKELFGSTFATLDLAGLARGWRTSERRLVSGFLALGGG